MIKSRNDVCDARCQQFARECANKTEKLKTAWFIKNKNRLYANLEKQSMAQKHQALQLKEKVDHNELAREEIVKPRAFKPWRPAESTVNLDLMKPIEPDVEQILYVPIDESFLSKKKYLTERYKKNPEDKFYYPYCSSWDFGWRLKDFPDPTIHGNGRRSIIQSSFYQRKASSLQRDPAWYRMCQTSDPNNFNELLG